MHLKTNKVYFSDKSLNRIQESPLNLTCIFSNGNFSCEIQLFLPSVSLFEINAIYMMSGRISSSAHQNVNVMCKMYIYIHIYIRILELIINYFEIVSCLLIFCTLQILFCARMYSKMVQQEASNSYLHS